MFLYRGRKMKNRLLHGLLLLGVFLGSIVKVYGYTTTDDYLNYINNIDISYEDLDLTPEELNAIEELQKNGGITYGIYDNEQPVKMVFDQIAKVFNINTIPIEYKDNFNQLLRDVADGTVDFTSNILPTEARMSIYDYTFPTNKERVFLFGNRSEYIQFYTNPESLKENYTIVYPDGFVYRDLIENSLGKIFDINYKTAKTAKEARQLIENGEADLIICSIPWYEELSKIDNYVGINYTDSINTSFSGSVAKRGTNKELISAINKLYMETSAVAELQQQIDNYYEHEILNIVSKQYRNIIESDKTLTILANEHKPYVYIENNKTEGLLVELLDRILNHFNISYKIEIVNGDIDIINNIDYIKSKNTDIIMPVLLDEHSIASYSLTLPIVETNMSIIAKEKNKSNHLTKIEDFNIRKIGAVKSSYMKEYIDLVFYSDDNVVYYKNIEDIVNALDNDEINYGLVSHQSFSKYAIKNSIINISAMNNVALPIQKVSFGMLKTEEGAALSLFLSSVLDSFNYHDLKTKYLSNKSEIEAIYKNRAKMLSYLAGIILFSAITIITLLLTIAINNKRRANTDYLTKLNNRRSLEQYIKVAKQKSGMCIAYIDLDNFKLVNDLYGHHYGDFLLIHVANELKKFSKYSKSYRIGGDEFIMIYNQNHINVKDIKEIFNNYIKIDGTDIKVEGSIGNIDLTKYAQYDVEQIINLVDYAMLVAKRKGKNTVIELEDELVNHFFATNSKDKLKKQSLIKQNSLQGLG